jgi:hypothetical protein
MEQPLIFICRPAKRAYSMDENANINGELLYLSRNYTAVRIAVSA